MYQKHIFLVKWWEILCNNFCSKKPNSFLTIKSYLTMVECLGLYIHSKAHSLHIFSATGPRLQVYTLFIYPVFFCHCRLKISHRFSSFVDDHLANHQPPEHCFLEFCWFPSSSFDSRKVGDGESFSLMGNNQILSKVLDEIEALHYRCSTVAHKHIVWINTQNVYKAVENFQRVSDIVALSENIHTYLMAKFDFGK